MEKICRDCNTTFILEKKRGRPAVKCEPCKNKQPTMLAFSMNNGVTVERKLEVVDGITWIESAEPCTECSQVFMRPRKRGRPPTKCEGCSNKDDANKAILVTTSQECLEQNFSGDQVLLQGTPSEIPHGAEAQCPRPRGCGRIFTSNSACDDHKVYGPDGNLKACKDPATLGMEPRERREIPVWTRPSLKLEI
jgi:DNA-directed RNA polymerase subunit M/transcription elongation factor TFIIS